MEHLIYPISTFKRGLYTRGDETETPPDAVRELLNMLWLHNRWTRKGGSAIYNATYMHATEEVRGGFAFNDGTINVILAVCNTNLFKTTGDGSMGSALTEPDTTAVSFANGDLDVYAVQYMNRLHLVNGDTSDYALVFNGTNVIDYALSDNWAQAGAWQAIDATNGTTTIDDATLTEADNYWNGQPIYIWDATTGNIFKNYITDFVAADDKLTFGTCDFTITTSDKYTMGTMCNYNDTTRMPRGLKFFTEHKDRLLGAKGSTVYFSNEYDPDGWTPENGFNYRYIGRDDGEDITALASMDDYLVVFKPHNIYVIRCIGDKNYWPITRITGFDTNKGAVWHKTVKRGFGGIVYMSWDGVYVLDRGLNVKCVSNNIEPTIKALTQSTSSLLGESVEKIDTTKVNFDDGTPVNIDTATESGTFRIDTVVPSTWVQTSKVDFDAGTDTNIDTTTVSGTFRISKTVEAIGTSYTTGCDDFCWLDLPYAQSFKVPINCTATKIELYIRKAGTPPTNLTVYLKADNNNSPGGTLATATILASDVGYALAWKTANITDTNLTANARYWIYLPVVGTKVNTYDWGLDSSSPTYTNGNLWENGTHWTGIDALFKVYEQHYNSSSNLVSQIKDLTAAPKVWGTFVFTQTLNGQSATWYVRSSSDSGMAGATAWTVIASGSIPTITKQRYFQWKCVFGTDGVTTPYVSDATLTYPGTVSTLISRIHDVSAVPVQWKKFDATEALNSCAVEWQVRSDDDSGMASPTAWTTVENGGIPVLTLLRYVQWKVLLYSANVSLTPVIEDVIIRAVLGTGIESPCAFIWNKSYWLSVRGTSSSVNNCIYVLDEEARILEGMERWSKLTGVYINEFLSYNDQLMGTSVGGTGKGGFLYHLDVGTTDLGSDFTARIITGDMDFSNQNIIYALRNKRYYRIFSKYKSQGVSSMYYRTNQGAWSSAISLPVHNDTAVEEDYFSGLARGKRVALKWEQTIVDTELELHGFGIDTRIERLL